METKKKSRVLLISPNIKGVNGGINRVMPRLGLGCLAAVLRDKGYDVLVRDTALEGYHNQKLLPGGDTLLIGETDQQIAAFIKEACPDIVGISVPFTSQNEIAKHTAKIVKSVYPNIPVIVGGSHITGVVSDYLYAKSRNMIDSQYEKIMRSALDDRNIDYAMIGECDYEFPMLVERLLDRGDISQVRNLVYFDNNSEFHTTVPDKAKCYSTVDLGGSIPRPALELFNMEKYFELGASHSQRTTAKRVYPIMATRGCPEKCAFCTTQNTFGRKIRWRNPASIAQEINEAIHRYGTIEEIQLSDDNITAHIGNLYELCHELGKIGIKWCTPNGTKANYHMDKQPDYYRCMKESGCYQITIACETGSQEVMDNSIGKNLKLHEIAESVENAKNAGLYVHTFWMVGFPFQTRESMEETVAFAASTGADSYSMSIYAPLPGTTLARTVIDNNLFWPEIKSRNNMTYRSSMVKADGFNGAEDFERWANKQNVMLNELLEKRNPKRFMAYESLKAPENYGKHIKQT